MSIEKINPGLPTGTKIDILSDQILELEGLIEQAKFTVSEIVDLYSGAGFYRKYLRNQPLGHALTGTNSYANWTHIQSETGYSIWRYAPANYAYNSVNQLYFDDKIAENKGQATTETATAFDFVYLYDGSYHNYTTEASTALGTEFALMDSVNDYLYLGDSSDTFKGAKFEFQTFGSNYALKPEIFYSGASFYNWMQLTNIVDSFEDNTLNFASDGSITYNLLGSGSGWVKNTINSQNAYWMRLSTTTIPVTVADAYYIVPSDSVIGLLSLSAEQLQDDAWCWCTYASYVYVTIRNAGKAAYEGDYYITSSSSIINKQNFFVYNHEYELDYEDLVYSGSGYRNIIPEFNSASDIGSSAKRFKRLYLQSSIVDVNNMGIGTLTPDSKAILELSSSGAGLLLPRMTTNERNLITSAPTGLAVFNTTLHRINVCTGGGAWMTV